MVHLNSPLQPLFWTAFSNTTSDYIVVCWLWVVGTHVMDTHQVVTLSYGPIDTTSMYG